MLTGDGIKVLVYEHNQSVLFSQRRHDELLESLRDLQFHKLTKQNESWKAAKLIKKFDKQEKRTVITVLYYFAKI